MYPGFPEDIQVNSGLMGFSMVLPFHLQFVWDSKPMLPQSGIGRDRRVSVILVSAITPRLLRVLWDLPEMIWI